MRYSIKHNWLNSLDLLTKRREILLPFILFAFFEGLALELVYFSSRKPISFALNPIIRKFFGEGYLHYPGNLIILPRLFYIAQVALYIAVGVFLIAVAINVIVNVKSKLPVKLNALIKNASKNYLSFFLFGILIIVLMALIKKVDMIFLGKFFRFTSRQFPNATVRFAPFIMPVFLFMTNMIMQALFVLIIPIIVVRKKALVKALISGLSLGLRNFFSLFILIFIPYLVYFPVFLLKSFSMRIVGLTFPEMNIVITAIGIIAALFVDCFVVTCATNFLLDKTKGHQVTNSQV